MSGGSYNYLCYQDLDTLRQSNLKAMIERLRELGHEDAAQESAKIFDLFDEIETIMDRMREVWHAVEWRDSGDYGRDQTTRIIEEWRNEQHV